MEELSGKVAVVTGGASGIGRAMAERFLDEGMKVVLGDIEEAVLDSTQRELKERGGEVLAVWTDVTDGASVQELAQRSVERFGAVHVVCNNAGVASHGYATWDGPRADWDWVLAVNLWGVIHGIRTFVPLILEQGEGHIVNTSSVAGLRSLPNFGPYVASKHAVLGISECLFHELALRGSSIGVTVLCPGWVKTGIVQSDRNWIDRFGAPEQPDLDPMGELLKGFVENAAATGLEPAVLAGQVVDAIRTNRFMVLTDEPMAYESLKARRAEVDGGAPTIPELGQ